MSQKSSSRKRLRSNVDRFYSAGSWFRVEDFAHYPHAEENAQILTDQQPQKNYYLEMEGFGDHDTPRRCRVAEAAYRVCLQEVSIKSLTRGEGNPSTVLPSQYIVGMNAIHRNNLFSIGLTLKARRYKIPADVEDRMRELAPLYSREMSVELGELSKKARAKKIAAVLAIQSTGSDRDVQQLTNDIARKAAFIQAIRAFSCPDISKPQAAST